MAEVKFFDTNDVLNIGGNWAVQSGPNPSTSRQRASALGANGDEVAMVQYGAQTQVSMSYKATATSGNLTLPKVGDILNGYHVDSVQLSYSQTDFPTLSVGAHKHGNAVHDECRTYSGSVNMPARAIGVPTLSGVFTLPDGVGLRSLSYSLALNHVDENDANGEHLAGDNYDGSETISVELTGEVTESELEIGEDWGLTDSFSASMSNNGAHTTSFTISKHIAHDIA